MRLYHDMLGHAGVDHTHRVLTQQVYWPDIRKDVRAYCLACIVCQQRKAVMYQPDAIQKTEIHGALNHVHVDLAGPFKVEGTVPAISDKVQQAVTFEQGEDTSTAGPEGHRRRTRTPGTKTPSRKKGKQAKTSDGKPDASPAQQHWILIIVDYFTKAAELVAVPTKAADTIAHALYDNWFCRYGTPQFVTSDNGTEFQGDFAAMLERLGIIHVTTAVRHPQSNGACERLVGTIKRKLYKYCDGHALHWISYLPRLRYAYMQEIHTSTRISPFELLHGFIPNHPLPVSINAMTIRTLDVPDKSYLDHVMQRELVDAEICRHVDALREKYMQLDQEVKDNINDMQDKEIERFNQRKLAFHRRLPGISVGDYVFEIRESPKPMQAIADGPFLVVDRCRDRATLRTGVTKWEPIAKEFTRRVELLAPCLTRRQAVAKAHGDPYTSALREAPLTFLPVNSFLEVTFELPA